MRWIWKKASTAWILVAVSFSLARPASAQTCTWGGTPSVVPPSATALRAYRDFFHAPGRVAIDGSGNLYTTDPQMGRVFVTDPYGRLTSIIEVSSPLGIAVDKDGRIYVGEQGKGRVAVFDQQGNPFGKLGQGDGEFQLPNDLAIDPDPQYGWIYVSDSGAHTIKVYKPDGSPVSFGGKGTGPEQFDFPAGIYVSATGEVFVADQNNDRVQVFDRGGTFLRCFGRSGSFSFSRKFGRIQGLTGDVQGRVYVADAFQGYVQVFDESGGLLTTIGSFGEGLGQFRTPMDLVIDPYNRLFVTSANNARVEVFGLDSFLDPHVIQAVVDVKPDTLERSSNIKAITAYIEIASSPLEEMNPSTITANGVPANPSPVAIGDYDDDGIPDLMVKFDAQAFLALPEGEAIIVVSGKFTDKTPFEGADTVRVQGGGKK